VNLVDRICERIYSLPTLPTVYATLSELVENPRTTPEDAASVIANDQASAFKVLRSANSAFYGLHGRIDTISQAIIHLGFNEVKNLVAAISIINIFSKNTTPGKFDPVDFWAHSIGVGVITRYIGQATGREQVENFFLAGVLHDVGKLIFIEYAKNEYIEALTLAGDKGIPIKDAEMMVLGIDHTFAGGLLADKWKIPESIKNVIHFHHAGIVDDDHDNNQLVASVHVANICAKLFNMGCSGDTVIPQPNYKVWDILDFPENAFSARLPKLMRDYEETVARLLAKKNTPDRPHKVAVNR